MTIIYKTTALTGLVLLTACGGSNNAGSTIALSGSAASATEVSTNTGSFDEDTNALTVGAFSGTLNGNGTQASGGGDTLDISDTGTDDVTAYSDGTSFGVYGDATAVSDIPTGAATYSGSSQLAVIDSNGLYELSGDAAIAANFDTGQVSADITDLNGTQITGIGPDVDVSNGGTVSIDGMTMTGATFSGGTVLLDSTVITSTATANAISTTSGGFYGSDADEVGGVFRLDDQATGDQLIFGNFVGD